MTSKVPSFVSSHWKSIVAGTAPAELTVAVNVTFAPSNGVNVLGEIETN